MKNLIIILSVLGSFSLSAQHELLEAACFNSSGDDYCVRMIDGKQYFISDIPDQEGNKDRDRYSGKWFTDIYETSGCSRQEAKLVKNSIGENVSINSSWYDGPISYSIKDSVLFFSNTSEGYVHGKMGIYWSKEFPDGSYSDPVAFPLNSDEYSCMHPFFDEEKSELYFVSDAAEDSTGFDLYRIAFDGVSFGKLDTLVQYNSMQNELFPIVYNGTLYFSSDRNGGVGGIDLYKVEKGQVFAMESPFNSSKDDFAISFNSDNRGFFASNRGVAGDDDIYEFYIPDLKSKPLADVEINPVISELEGLLEQTESNSSEAIILQAAIEKLREQEQVIRELKEQMMNQQDRMMDYADTASYLSFEERINIYQQVIEGNVSGENSDFNQLPEELATSVEEMTSVRNEVLSKVEEETKFVESRLKPFLDEQPKELGHINEIVAHYDMNDEIVASVMATTYPFEFYFDFDHFDLTEEQLNEVGRFVSSVKGYNGKITLTGHTDSKGAASYNMNLSKRRAQYIAKLLVKEGFDKENIIIVPKGETEPAVSNDTREGRAKNRRVIVTL